MGMNITGYMIILYKNKKMLKDSFFIRILNMRIFLLYYDYAKCGGVPVNNVGQICINAAIDCFLLS